MRVREVHRQQHHIVEQLRDRRIKYRIRISELAREIGTSRSSITNHEETKFGALTLLDRWAHSLGYKLVLIDNETSEK